MQPYNWLAAVSSCLVSACRPSPLCPMQTLSCKTPLQHHHYLTTRCRATCEQLSTLREAITKFHIQQTVVFVPWELPPHLETSICIMFIKEDLQRLAALSTTVDKASARACASHMLTCCMRLCSHVYMLYWRLSALHGFARHCINMSEPGNAMKTRCLETHNRALAQPSPQTLAFASHGHWKGNVVSLLIQPPKQWDFQFCCCLEVHCDCV